MLVTFPLPAANEIPAFLHRIALHRIASLASLLPLAPLLATNASLTLESAGSSLVLLPLLCGHLPYHHSLSTLDPLRLTIISSLFTSRFSILPSAHHNPRAPRFRFIICSTIHFTAHQAHASTPANFILRTTRSQAVLATSLANLRASQFSTGYTFKVQKQLAAPPIRHRPPPSSPFITSNPSDALLFSLVSTSSFLSATDSSTPALFPSDLLP